VQLVDRSGFDSLWVGDHIAFAIPILDPLLQLAQAAVVSRRLLFGTSVYLLPLRHAGPVAKQVATLDHLTEGRLIFGVGVGGEFPKEYALAGAPIRARGSAKGSWYCASSGLASRSRIREGSAPSAKFRCSHPRGNREARRSGAADDRKER
jgi:hypothetical protein